MLPITNHPLDQLFASNPGAFQQGMQQMRLERLFKEQEAARAQEQLNIQRDQNERLREKDRLESLFRKEENDRKNKEFDAKLPLLQAEADTARTRAEVEKAKAPAEIEEIVSRTASRADKARLDRMNAAGTVLSQAAAIARSPGGRKAARKYLEDNGFGQFYDERWDQGAMVDDANIGLVLDMFGQEMTRAVAPFIQKQSLQDDAAAARAALQAQQDAARAERDRAEQTARERLEAQKAEFRRQALAEAQRIKNEAKQGNTKETWQNAAVRLWQASQQAQQSGDMELAATLYAQAQEAQRAATELISVPPSKPTIDPSIAPGVLTPGPTRQPGLTQPPGGPNNPTVQPSQGSPAQQRPQTLSDLQKLYPNVPPEKLREAYKKKFGIDLK